LKEPDRQDAGKAREKAGETPNSRRTLKMASRSHRFRRSRCAPVARVVPVASSALALLVLCASCAAAPASRLASMGGDQGQSGSPPLRVESRPAAIMPLAEVKAGQEGYGLTVFEGTRVDTFGVRVLGVQHNVRTAGSVILVELSGHDLELTAIPRGMSGSPVYLDGRLAGAVAFGWSGALRPIVGLTPAEEMQALPAAPESPAGEALEAGPEISPAGLLATGQHGRYLSHLVLGTADPVARQEPTGEEGARGPERLSVWPLATSRAWPDGAELGRSLVEALIGPSPSGPGDGLADGGSWRALPLSPAVMTLPAREADQPEGRPASTQVQPIPPRTGIDPDPGDQGVFGPGSACGVALVLGDAALGAIGTVTQVEGDRVTLMGHPFMQQGPVALPLANAEIVGVFPSRQISFKLGGIGSVIGTVHHDQRAGLAGTLGDGPPMTPVRVRIERPGSPARDYSFQVARDVRLTPALVFWCMYNALLVEGDDLSLQTVRYVLDTEWSRPSAAGPDGTAAPARTGAGEVAHERLQMSGAVAGPGSVMGLANEWIAPLQILLANRHEPLALSGVKATLTITRPMEVGTVASVQADLVARPGQDLPLRVTIERRRQEPLVLERRLSLPAHLPPGHYRLLVASAKDVFALESQRAEALFKDGSLTGTLDLLRMDRGADQLATVLYAPSRGVVIDGREFPDLPGSVQDLLQDDPTGYVTPTVAGLVASDRYDTGLVLSGNVVRDLEIRVPQAPTPKEERP
jgi:hypothetical protein